MAEDGRRERDPDEIGALWQRDSAKGPYLAGHVEIDGVKHRIVAFKVGRKASDKAPDFRVLKGRERQQ